ncbi:FtsW/RodA/SpoVE family cell cycle protein [Clostridium chrysemydis]|uniref:FtsW/RodA/SpoVE family cell cycle protein n=1 Tax=Clostridium chrysemydis TaxID=2665504 RepID=UPI001883E4FE|nr:FtsW/RodA/SpoVE family cell cycle protein [Clostridium chrysemydis]
MKKNRSEVMLLVLIYILCMALFTNLAILKDPIDKNAIYIGLLICVVISVAYLIIRKFDPDGDRFILLFSSLLVTIGIAMLYRLDPSVGKKQLIWFIAGIAIFIVVVRLFPSFKSFSKFKVLYFIGVIAFMPMAMVIGTEQLGAKNWVFIGGFGFQPSEFGKICLILYLAATLKDYSKASDHAFKTLIKPAFAVGFSLIFLVLQKDLGSALIFFGIAVTMLYIATSKKKYVFASLGLFGAGSVVAYKLFAHVRRRVLIWKNPWEYANDQGYQLVQGFYAISSGGMFGSGLGQGHPTLVPVPTTDFIFAAICEELGMVFGIGVMIIYFLLFYRAIRTAFVSDDSFSQLAGVGFSTMIVCQVLVIIGGVFAVIPLTGIALPLVSYGGTSMVTTFLALGILQKISEEG